MQDGTRCRGCKWLQVAAAGCRRLQVRPGVPVCTCPRACRSPPAPAAARPRACAAARWRASAAAPPPFPCTHARHMLHCVQASTHAPCHVGLHQQPSKQAGAEASDDTLHSHDTSAAQLFQFSPHLTLAAFCNAAGCTLITSALADPRVAGAAEGAEPVAPDGSSSSSRTRHASKPPRGAWPLAGSSCSQTSNQASSKLGQGVVAIAAIMQLLLKHRRQQIE